MLSNLFSTRHINQFKFKLIKIKEIYKLFSSVVLVTIQVPISHMWLVATFRQKLSRKFCRTMLYQSMFLNIW